MNLHPMLIVAFGTLVSLYISFWSFRNFDRNMFKRQSILYIANFYRIVEFHCVCAPALKIDSEVKSANNK